MKIISLINKRVIKNTEQTWSHSNEEHTGSSFTKISAQTDAISSAWIKNNIKYSWIRPLLTKERGIHARGMEWKEELWWSPWVNARLWFRSCLVLLNQFINSKCNCSFIVKFKDLLQRSLARRFLINRNFSRVSWLSKNILSLPEMFLKKRAIQRCPW